MCQENILLSKPVLPLHLVSSLGFFFIACPLSSLHDRRKTFFLQLPRHRLCIFPFCECAALYDVAHLLRCV